MDNIAIILTSVCTVFLLVGVGFIVRRLGVVDEGSEQGILRLLVNVFAPCLILDSVLGNEALRHAGNVIIAPILGFLLVSVLVGVAYLAGALGVEAGPRRRTFAVSAGLQNYGFIALPLALSLFDLKTVGVLFVFNIGVEIALWTVCVWTLRGTGIRGAWKQLLNTPLVAIALGLTLNGLNLGDDIPLVVARALEWLGACAIPMGLLLTGVTVAGLLSDLHFRRGRMEAPLGIFLRQMLFPLAFLAFAAFLPISLELKRVLVLQAAMPCAVIPIVLSKLYGMQPGTAMRVILVSNFAGLLTIPFWLHIGISRILSN